MTRPGSFVSFLLIFLFALPIAILPLSLSLRAGGILGGLLFHFWKKRRAIAVRNLSDAVSRGALSIEGTPEAVIKENFRNLGRSFAEIIKVYFNSGCGQIFEKMELRGVENFRKAHEKGKGILCISGHCGNWELTGLGISAHLAPVTGVARPLENPYLNRLAEKARERYGNKVIYKQGALKKLITCLKRNEVVGVMIDQSVIRSEGIITEFLGKNAYTMKMPAMIARRTGAAVLPIFIRRDKDRHILEIGKEIELDKSDDPEKAIINDTIAFSRTVEEYIKRNPYEWLWIHRKWKRIKD